MGREYKVKSFKSGNSVALRMPAALGLEPGREWRVVEEEGKLIIEQVPEQPRKIDLTGIWGSIPDLKQLSPEDRAMEPRELDWDGKLLKRG